MTCPFPFLNCIVNIVFLSLIAHFSSKWQYDPQIV
jgi:hypothetical protein